MSGPISWKSVEMETAVAEAVRAVCGAQAQVSRLQVAPAATQGFIALILRVTAVVVCSPEVVMTASDLDTSSNIPQPREQTLNFVAKCVPTVESQKKKVIDDEIILRESLYFEKAVPILKKRCADLPIVCCYVPYPNMIIMEDLTALGYEILIKSMKDAAHVLNLSHVLLVIKKLAQLHAASVDINWLEIIPYLNKDCVLESKDQAFLKLFENSCKAYAKVIGVFYPELNKKYSSWLTSTDIFKTLLKLLKPNRNNMNILSHGDCWTSNILFKVNPVSNAPDDLKFIDFPSSRFVPPSRDIQYLLYSCTDKRFRDLHKEEIFATYVQSFNTTLGFERLKLEDLVQEYESSRLYGVCMAIVFRTLNLMPELYPDEGEQLTEEQDATLSSGSYFESIPHRCREDSPFSKAIREIVDEYLQVSESFFF